MKQRPEMIEHRDGTRLWYLNGLLHREGGPAVEWSDGSREWWFNDQLHREDGPAVERADGTRRWWIRGQELTEEEFKLRRFVTWVKQGPLDSAHDIHYTTAINTRQEQDL